MKTTLSSAFHPHAFFVLGCLLSLGGSALQAQNQTISGDLNVTGSMDVAGNTFNLGTWCNDATKLGLNVNYVEDEGYTALLSLITTRPIVQWQWLRAASATDASSVPQMTLSSSNALTLFDVALPYPQAAIVLDPVFGSRFATDVTLQGVNNKMPNQQLADEASVLTLGLADGRYVPRGTGNTLSLGYLASAAGSNSTALGAYSQASGTESTALSYAAHATGSYSVALGNSSAATGLQSTALGAYSAATGDLAMTLGYGSLASGGYATALGYGSRATGGVATALGAYSKAYGDFSLTLGDNATADSLHASALGVYSWAHADSATTLGFASQALNSLSSALGPYTSANGWGSVALGTWSITNGFCSVASGPYSIANGDWSSSAGRTQTDSLYQFAVGAYNLTGGNTTAWVPTDDLFTVGNGSDGQHRSNAFSVKKNGDTTVAGKLTVASNVTVSGALIILPQGDLQMGEFTAQPSPTP